MTLGSKHATNMMALTSCLWPCSLPGKATPFSLHTNHSPVKPETKDGRLNHLNSLLFHPRCVRFHTHVCMSPTMILGRAFSEIHGLHNRFSVTPGISQEGLHSFIHFINPTYQLGFPCRSDTLLRVGTRQTKAWSLHSSQREQKQTNNLDKSEEIMWVMGQGSKRGWAELCKFRGSGKTVWDEVCAALLSKPLGRGLWHKLVEANEPPLPRFRT